MNALTILLALACESDSDTAEAVDDPALVDPEAWSLVEAAADPFTDRFEADCSALGFGPEGSAFEVQTAACPYATFSQPLLRDLIAGEIIEISAWHLELSARESAQGHLAVQLGSDVAQIQPEIPGEAAAYTLTLTLSRSMPAGEPVFFHVHNHGSNSWYLGEIEALPESPGE